MSFTSYRLALTAAAPASGRVEAGEELEIAPETFPLMASLATAVRSQGLPAKAERELVVEK